MIRDRVSLWRSGFSGMVGTARQGRLPARALAITDSRSLVRTLFLGSAARSGLLPYLGTERTMDELVEQTGCRRRDRLEAWLGVGVDLGELRRRGDQYGVVGLRARALAAGDRLLTAHYKSMLDYQVGPYADLDQLLRDPPGEGRDDLDRYCDDIAQVSLAAAPFVTSMVRGTLADLHPARVLDVGCGTGVYTKLTLESDSQVHVDGVDLAEEVILAARQELADAGLGTRAEFHVGDARDWLRRSGARFDLVMLLNNIYYFDRTRRQELYRELGAGLVDGGQLLVVSMTAPGSVAAAHLHFMLSCQEGSASLPGRSDLVADLAMAGYEIVEERKLVPTEPFVGVRAKLAR
jgi:SAM-dependent methyltransferase